jgi:hypothetical protein
MENKDTSLENARVIRQALLVFVGLFCIYCALRTQNILSVDGGNRCFAIYRRHVLYFDANNHLLHPAYVLVWARLATALGYRPKGPMEFFQLVAMMNCFAMAGGLAILFALTLMVVPRWRLVLGVTVGLGFAKAFILQATNANEPPMGLFWSLLAMLFAVLCFRVKSNWPVSASGASFAVAMATYQTMILLFPAALYLIWRARELEALSKRPNTNKRQFLDKVSAGQIWAFLVFAVSGVVATGIIFGFAYWYTGVHGTGQIVKRFLEHKDAHVYMGVGVGKTLNVPVGFLRNIWPVAATYTGLRGLWHGPKEELAVFLSLAVFASACALLLATATWKDRKTFSRHQQLALHASIIGLIFTTIPFFIWDPGYAKFWLQPLTCIAVLTTLAYEVLLDSDSVQKRIAITAAGLLFISINANLVWATRDHEQESPDLQQAQQIAQIVGPNDFVIGAWNGAAILYGAIYAREDRFLDFNEDAVFHRRKATFDLDEATAETAKRGGKVYFVGVLDDSKAQWDAFLGARCGIPYSDLADYRVGSIRINNFDRGTTEVTLWRFDPMTGR